MELNHAAFAIFIMSLTQTLVHSTITCEEAPRNCECLYNAMVKELELPCPSKTNQEAVVKYKPQTLHVTCFNTKFDVSSLNLEMRNVQLIYVYSCKAINDLLFNQLSNASNLTDLKFSNGHLQDIHVEVLQQSIKNLNVESVTLNRNELKKFPEGFSNLYELDLSHNFIRRLPDRLNAPQLIVLRLKNNRIDYLNDFVFETSPNLKFIDLSDNNITYLPPQLLHPLKQLKVLWLPSNNFSSVPDGFLERNTALVEVTLSNGGLTAIGANMFSNCTRLETLRLANNSLQSLPEDIFLNMKGLKYLELSMNLFSDFPKDVFNGLERLQQLFLFGNRLTSWSGTFNRYLNKLFRLELNNNTLSTIGDDTFSGLDNLRYLDLSHNDISAIDITAFTNLKKLTELNLSFNKLETPDAMVTVPIGRPSSEKKINLSFNKISRINMPNADIDISTSITRPKYLCFTGNPINCDCQIFDLLKYLNGHQNHSKSFDMLCNEECTTPSRWEGIKLKDINLEKFNCEDATIYDCPEQCNCHIHPARQILKIDCSDAGLTRPPIISPLNQSLFDFNIILNEIWVDLSNNSISDFTAADHTYRYVKVLNLSSNNLGKINWIPPNVEMLCLDNNKLTAIDNNIVQLLNRSSSLKQVTMKDNPWICDCEMVHFAKTLRSDFLKMIPNNSLICPDGSFLMDLDEPTACAISESFIVIIVLLSLILVLLILILTLYIHFQNHLKLWLYNHKLLLSLIKEKDTDMDKTYDAFVSYSHKDEEFVLKHLVQELEHGQEKYKLCLHERDWVVGEYISKQIVDSVQQSRRTIIVLSKNFLVSEWANMEFQTAHSKSLLDERNRLIIILYDDIEVNDIYSEELKLYLNTKTYIKWGDPWFWKKLKQALPVRKNSKISKRSKRNAIVEVEKCIDT